jgi:hypothetical protein
MPWKETEWSYMYKLGEKSFGGLSKFSLDENFTFLQQNFAFAGHK